MSSLQKQILSLFEDVDPALKEVVTDVMLVEQEFIHMERPRGVMERIDHVLDRVAKDMLKEEGNHED
jgi:hypothetical protein